MTSESFNLHVFNQLDLGLAFLYGVQTFYRFLLSVSSLSWDAAVLNEASDPESEVLRLKCYLLQIIIFIHYASYVHYML